MFSLQTLGRLAGFFFRDPKSQAEIDAFEATATWWSEARALPSFAKMEDADEALIKIEGWGVARDSQTNRITDVIPPEQNGGRASGANRGGLMAPGT